MTTIAPLHTFLIGSQLQNMKLKFLFSKIKIYLKLHHML